MDSEVLETIKLLFDEQYTSIRFQLVVIIAIGLILYILTNLIIPLLINRSNRKNEIKRQKIERTLADIEITIDNLKTIQTAAISSDSMMVPEKIKEVREFVNRRTYRFKTPMRDAIYDLLDYYMDCICNRINKNPEIESGYFDLIFKEYEKLT